MKNLSENKYILQSNLNAADIIPTLKGRTVLQEKLTYRSSTKKDFAGQIRGDSFSIFYASPGGAACVLNGQVESDSRITVTATLNRGFRILFLIGLIIIASVAAFSWWFDNPSREVGFLYVIFLPICLIAFRFFLHIKYVKARDLGMEKLKSVLMAEG